MTAGVVVLTLLFLTPLFENLPQATLAAVVIVAVAGLVDLAALRRIRDLRVRDFGLALVALAGVLVLGVLQGVLLAVVVAMLTLIYGANHPPIEVLGRKPGTDSWQDLDRHPDGENVPGLLVIRPVASIYFANGPRVRRRLLDLIDAAAPRPQVVLLDLGAVPDIDVTALEVLASFDSDLRGRGSRCGWPTSTPGRWRCSGACPTRRRRSGACSSRSTTPWPRSRPLATGRSGVAGDPEAVAAHEELAPVQQQHAVGGAVRLRSRRNLRATARPQSSFTGDAAVAEQRRG